MKKLNSIRYIYKVAILFFSIYYLLPVFLFSHKGGNKYLTNYDYKANDSLPQNWWVSQDKNGVIYVGNLGGLLEYDGVSWRKKTVPQYLVRSIAVDDPGTIYIGGRGEIGRFMVSGGGGELEYQSLLPFLEERYRKFSSVYQAYKTKEGIYFRTKEYLFRWNGVKFDEWKSDTAFRPFFIIGGVFYVQQKDRGLKVLRGDKLVDIPGGDFFSQNFIRMMAPFDSQRILVCTRKKGFFIYDGRSAIPFLTEADELLKKADLLNGTRLSTGDYALATHYNGLVIIDGRGKLEKIYNKDSGIMDNNVKYVFEDKEGNIWLALNEGLSKIEYSSPLTIYDERSKLTGLIQAVTRHKGQLYAGSTDGLFTRDSNGEFTKVPGITGNCWALLPVDELLFAAMTEGVYAVSGNVNRKIFPESTYALLRSGKDPRRIWMGTIRGLTSLYLDGGDAGEKAKWQVERSFNEIKDTIQSIVEDSRGNLWLGTKAHGVFNVEFPVDGTIHNPAVISYGSGHGLPKGEIYVAFGGGHVMFASEKGLYRFNKNKGRFIQDTTLGEEFADGTRNIFRLKEADNGDIWFHSNNQNYQAVQFPDETFKIISEPFRRIPEVQVNGFYPEPVGKITWFAGSEAVVKYDATIKKDYGSGFRTRIRDVVINGKSRIYGGYGVPSTAKSSAPVFDYQNRNFRFRYAALFFGNESANRFQYNLEGFDPGWSEWTEETQKDYTNLDSGVYTFRVRSRNVYGRIGEEDAFRFKILSPWYLTIWAYIVYVLALILLMYLAATWRSSRLKQEKIRLEGIVKKRTKEINEKNRQLETQTLQLKEQAEKLQEMDRVKSRFFANISHEFRTPLTLMMGPVEQMISNSREEREKQQLKMVYRNSQRLLSLINRLLDLSRIDSGKMKLHAGSYDIIPFLKGIIASFHALADRNKLQLIFVSEEDTVSLYFNPENLEEIITNLLVNAVKFTPPGGKITVSVRKILPSLPKPDTPPAYLEISVQDTGIGIPKDQLSYIFDRFYQAEGPDGEVNTRKGSGIGLALTKELICLHHGEIDVHSGEGKGTEFIIRLPMGKEHLEPDEISEISAAPDYQPHLDKTDEILNLHQDEEQAQGTESVESKENRENVILVVEDHADVRAFIRGSLEADYKVVEAVNGKEGIDMAREIIPDLIISDIMMPGTDGFQLCGALKTDINTCHIPIVMLTAKASEESIIKGLETGADDYITKPFNTKILTTRIKNLIDLRRQLQLKIQRQKMLLPHEIQVSSMDQKFLRELQELIEKNLSNPEFNIDYLCKKLYMGRSTLFRKVQALTGETPNQFIRSFRLERAAQLLNAKFGNISEVALEVGFSNFAYFSKCFKDKFHQLPSAFLES